MQDIERLNSNWRYLFVRNFRLNCYETLWLYIDKTRLQSIGRVFFGNLSEELFIMEIQPDFYIDYDEIGLVSVHVKNWNLEPRNKFHAIPHIPVRSFAGLHRGSFVVGDHLGRWYSTKIQCLTQSRLDTYKFSLPCCCALVLCLPYMFRTISRPFEATKTGGGMNVIKTLLMKTGWKK